jgi:methylmalonyl-CoA mutase N-terminal domain/subunit
MVSGQQSEINKYQTFSGMPLKNVYTPGDVGWLDYDRHLGDPGQPPYRRGCYPNMYRSKLWRIFQLEGYASPEEQRERILYLLNTGADGFQIEIDQMTSCQLYDPDHPEVLARKFDVGLTGTPFVSLRDYEDLLDGIPIEKVFATAGGAVPQLGPFAHACYWSVAEKRGIPLNKLRGTGESDFFVSYLSCPIKDEIPPQAALRLNCDLVEFCMEHLPGWVPVSVAVGNASESGLNAYEQLGAWLANEITYIDELLRRGKLQIDDFAHSLATVTICFQGDFFEHICTLRAARSMWYKLIKERYNAKDRRSFTLRINAGGAGSYLTYREPLNNIVRQSIDTLACALGGAQSIQLACYDEAICIPTERAHLLAVRTQQIVQHESGVTKVADPLGGSYFVECLTNEIERKSWEYLEKIEAQGGFIKALDSGWLHREVARRMMEHQRKIDSGELKVVGVNCFQLEREPYGVEVFRGNPNTWEIAMEKLQRLRAERDNRLVEIVLAELREVCQSNQGIMPVMMKAAKAYATVGEVGKIFREVFSTWEAPLPF